MVEEKIKKKTKKCRKMKYPQEATPRIQVNWQSLESTLCLFDVRN